MDHIPILVIGCVAIFSASDSLVLLSCCNKWLRYCVSQQNNFWYQRYKQYYNIADGNEVKWLAWYVKTTRASKLLTLQTKKTINIAQLHNQHIEWFHAFCYRRATDVNWLKDTPYPVKDIVEKEPDNARSIILQRIAYHRNELSECFIAEQCQLIGEAFTKRFWRLRRLFMNDVDYMSYAKQCLISDRFVVVISTQANCVNFSHKTPCLISIWPVHLVSIMRPRQFSCLCSNASIRGRWMLVNHIDLESEQDYGSDPLAITRVFDLANGQRCMGIITKHYGETFLLRVTDEAAIVFSKSLDRSNATATVTLRWNVWEFSNRHIGYGPRCLMQGEIHFEEFDESEILVKKLDDTRVLIENNSHLSFDEWNKSSANEISLAMISTECGYSNVCIKDVNPIWTYNNYFYGTVPLFGYKHILVISKREWTVHSIIDGAILARIDLETLSLMPAAVRMQDTIFYNSFFSLYIGRFIIYESQYDDAFIAMDLIHPNRIKSLGIENSNYLYEKLFGHPYILTRFDRLIGNHLLLNDTFDTRNTMVVVDNEDYKIVDLSF
ncbi:hypothetical protein BDF19DRAFT_463856 [Syncephalis fuscata]|nr:hypothetical protein BDF19DRAFT_463856 [Syncephalis fuscata]